MRPHYYLMRCKKILRLEWDISFDSLAQDIRAQLLSDDQLPMNQDQANWRVVIFRDEIMELDEYLDWFATAEAMAEDEDTIELIAN